MPKSFQRSSQVADLIRHEVTHFIQREIRDPRLNTLSITHVDVSPDLGLAKIYYTLLQESNPEMLVSVSKALEKATAYIRHLLSQNVKMRYIPQLRFIHDDSLIKAEKLHNLIEKVTDDENRKK